MTVPLIAEAFVGADERQRVRLWLAGGDLRVHNAPLMPYVFTSKPIGAGAPVSKRALGSLETGRWFLSRFKSEKELRWRVKNAKQMNVVIAEERVGLVERVLIDKPSWFVEHANAQQLTVMYVDIEQVTDGKVFPKPTDPVSAIAWAVNDEPVECVLGEDAVQAFQDALKHHDPDVLVGYNLESYDLPVLSTHRVRLGRTPEACKSFPKQRRTSSGATMGTGYSVPGRVVFDTRWSVELDHALSGIADRKLKTVAKWLNLPHVEVEGYDLNALSADELHAYNVSDVELLRTVTRRYLPDKVALANDMGAPLDLVLNGGSSFAAGIRAARVLRAVDVVSDGSNAQRYADYLPLDEKGKSTKYEGATVALYKRGTFEPCHKADYASLYPRLMASLRCGPDNTRVTGFVPYVATQAPLALVSESPTERVYHVADHKLSKAFRIVVTGDSAFARDVEHMMSERLAVKQQAANEQDTAAKTLLDARSGMLKIVLNSLYGYMGADFAAHGSKAVAMLVTAGGRAMAAALESAVGHEQKVETDTDGVYYEGNAHTTAHLEQVVNEYAVTLGMVPAFTLDQDHYDAAYFYKAKTYGVRVGSKITWHGGAFKGSVHPEVFRHTIRTVGAAVLNRGDVAKVARAARELGQYELQDFTQTTRYSGKQGASVGNAVAQTYKNVYGVLPTVGERLSYVRTSQGYEYATPEALARLDHSYYLSKVDDALERLGALDKAKPKVSLKWVKV